MTFRFLSSLFSQNVYLRSPIVYKSRLPTRRFSADCQSATQLFLEADDHRTARADMAGSSAARLSVLVSEAYSAPQKSAGGVGLPLQEVNPTLIDKNKRISNIFISDFSIKTWNFRRFSPAKRLRQRMICYGNICHREVASAKEPGV